MYVYTCIYADTCMHIHSKSDEVSQYGAALLHLLIARTSAFSEVRILRYVRVVFYVKRTVGPHALCIPQCTMQFNRHLHFCVPCLA